MKNSTRLFAMSLVAAGLFSCSSDEDPIVENGLKDTDNVFVKVKVQLPTSQNSRTESPSTGTEIGTEEENAVTSMDVYLVTNDGKVATVSSPGELFVGDNGYYTVTFTKDQIQSLITTGATNLKVYVVCNPNTDLTNTAKDNVQTAYATLNEITQWPNMAVRGNQMMTNATEAVTITIPENITSNNSVDHPYDLTQGKAILVERASARFDYGVAKDNNTYTLLTEGKDGSVATTDFNIQLTDMALTNISKEFYHFRRVSPTGAVKDQVLGGAETATNYVVDVFGDNAQNKNKKFFYPFTIFHENKIGTIAFNKLPTTTTADADNWSGAFTPMAYATENAIASDATVSVDINTGVIFQGQINYTGNTESGTLGDRFIKSKRVYVYDDHMFVDWKHVEEVTQEPGTSDRLKAAYNEAIKSSTGTISPDGPNIAIAKKAGFKVFSKNFGERLAPVYYYYWNKHNAATENQTNPDSEISPMEYAVVRNNVYKLKVNSIKRFGHPLDDEGDPDKPIIVEKDLYLSVSVEVLPWTVRENNIEF